MAKKVLLTRSKEDNKVLRDVLSQKKYLCFDCSLIEHYPKSFNLEALESFTDIIITSKRAANIIPVAKSMKNAWVVGQASANILKAKNYNIKHIASSASALITVLPDNVKMIYLSGNNVSVKMPPFIKTMEIYKVQYKDSLSETEIDSIKSGLDYILLYSENCAKTLTSLIVNNNLLKYLENSIIVAISSKVAKIAEGYFKTIVAPSAGQILEELERYDKKKSIRN